MLNNLSYGADDNLGLPRVNNLGYIFWGRHKKTRC